MRRSFLLYLFVFTALIAVFLYVTSRRMLESSKSEISELQTSLNSLQKEMDSVRTRKSASEIPGFTEKDQAMSYFEERGMEASEIKKLIEDEIFSKNQASEDNSLITYDGMEGDMRINKIHILNHKWIIADFTDGTYWGEVFITYFVDDNQDLHLETKEAVLYPKY